MLSPVCKATNVGMKELNDGAIRQISASFRWEQENLRYDNFGRKRLIIHAMQVAKYIAECQRVLEKLGVHFKARI